MLNLTALLIWALPFQGRPKPDISMEERLLTTIPEDVVPIERWFSPDGRKAVCRARRGSKEFVIVGDFKGKEYDEAWYPFFTPDNKSVVYQARRNGRYLIVIGETEIDCGVRDAYPHFTPGGVLIYTSNKEGKYAVVVGDRIGESFDYLSFPKMGNEIAYVGRRDKRDFLILGDRSFAEHDRIHDLQFSPDGQSLAYAAQDGGKSFLVIGDKKGPSFDSVGDPIFSPDGKRVAYRACSWKEDKSFVVVDNHEGERFDSIYNLTFSPDGKSLAYRAQIVGKSVAVLNGRKGEEFDRIWSLRFSPDGSTLAYTAQTGDRHFLVVGQSKVSIKGSAMYSVPVFGPDSKTLALKMRLDNSKEVVVVGDRKSEEYSAIRNLSFSPDGKAVAFGAIKGRELWWKVMGLE